MQIFPKGNLMLRPHTADCALKGERRLRLGPTAVNMTADKYPSAISSAAFKMVCASR